MRKFIITSALTALSLVAFATPVSAETQSVTVSYGDLDLDTPQGIATLESRIQAASRKICGSTEVRDIHDGVDQQRCVQATNASVTIELARLTGKPSVLALNAARNNRR
jgi:UrcA family protein